MMTHTPSRLDTIATRQKKSFARDLVFAALIALAAIVAVTSIATAAEAATPALKIAQR
jgi:hypothetical protein